MNVSINALMFYHKKDNSRRNDSAQKMNSTSVNVEIVYLFLYVSVIVVIIIINIIDDSDAYTYNTVCTIHLLYG